MYLKTYDKNLERGNNMISKKKFISAILAISIVAALAVGGTLAYLTAQTESVVNTFTVGKIAIDLYEHPLKGGDNYDGKTIDTEANTVKAVNNYKMMPGSTLQKDPTVEVKVDSEKSYVFVKIEKSSNFDTYMEFTVADGWTALSGQDGVYYRVVDSTVGAANASTFKVLANDQVAVKDTVTTAQMKAAGTTNPTLTFTAYAVQFDNVTDASAAWTAAQAAATNASGG